MSAIYTISTSEIYVNIYYFHKSSVVASLLDVFYDSRHVVVIYIKFNVHYFHKSPDFSKYLPIMNFDTNGTPYRMGRNTKFDGGEFLFTP